MLIVQVNAKRKQKESEINFKGLICEGDIAEDFYIELTPVRCNDDSECYRSTVYECGKPKEKPVSVAGTLRSKCIKLDGSKLTFEWDALLWDSKSSHYDVVLFYKCAPCGRFHIQKKCGSVSGTSINKICE